MLPGRVRVRRPARLGQCAPRPRLVVLLVSLCAALAVCALAAAPSLFAATVPVRPAAPSQSFVKPYLVVQNTADSGPGSLRQAILDAYPGYSISFAPAVTGTILLTSGQLVISTSVDIEGPGADVLAVNGNQKDRIFSIMAGATVNISALRIEGGVALSDNAYGGAGIKNNGTLTLTDSIVSGNISSSPYTQWGGGIFNEARLTVVRSSISNNAAFWECGPVICGYGAGIGNSVGAIATIISSTVSDNSSGSGIYNQGTLNLIDSVVAGNNGVVGGIVNGGTVNGGMLSILNSSVIGNSGYDYHSGGTGAIENVGSMIMTGTTISGNTSGNDYEGDVAGVWNEGTLEIFNSTISDNSSKGMSENYVVGLANFRTGILTIVGSIVASNTLNGAPMDCFGVTSAGHNLSDDASCSFTATGDISNTDARLVPLGDYGGPTWTQMPQPGSPAIDAGDNSVCPAFDQRGVPRPIDGNRDGNAVCDIGAVEFNLTRTISLPLVRR